MELQQRPELRHRVTLSPQVYQGLNILAMPIAELAQLIEVEMLENPVLEVDETETEPSEDEQAEEKSSEEEERSWDEWLEMYEDLDTMEPLAPRDPNAESPNTEEFVGGAQTFDDYLLEQIGMLDIDEEVMRDRDAHHRLARRRRVLQGVAARRSPDYPGSAWRCAHEALEVVQQLDPPGVGARDLTEALQIQMEYLGHPASRSSTRSSRTTSTTSRANHYRKVVARAARRRDRGAAARRGPPRTQPPARRRVLARAVARLHRARRHAAPVRRGLGHHARTASRCPR